MVALFTSLLFATAFAASVWSIWITIAPRLGYMRELVRGEAVAPLPQVAAPRARAMSRPAAISTMGHRPLRAAA